MQNCMAGAELVLHRSVVTLLPSLPGTAPAPPACTAGSWVPAGYHPLQRLAYELQVQHVDSTISEADAQILQLRQRIEELTPNGIPDAAAGSVLGRGARSAAGRATAKRGRTSQAEQAAVAAATAALLPAAHLAPMPIAIPPHFKPFMFHLPGRDPFSVRPALSQCHHRHCISGCQWTSMRYTDRNSHRIRLAIVVVTDNVSAAVLGCQCSGCWLRRAGRRRTRGLAGVQFCQLCFVMH